MEEQLVSFETAKLTKEKKFEWDTLHYYRMDGVHRKESGNPTTPRNYNLPFFVLGTDECYARPTQSLLQKWLRDVHEINVIVYPLLLNGITSYYTWDVYTDLSHAYAETDVEYLTYEEALEQGLYEALQLV